MIPPVTIGIPTYNRAALLSQAVLSVLGQRFQDFEIIVSDDWSPDDTAAVVRGFNDPRLRYHRPAKRLKVPANWNECVRLARGEFFALLPDDDVYGPEFLGTMVAALRGEPEVGFAHCGIYSVDRELRCLDILLAHTEALTMRGEEALIWQRRNLLCNPVALLFRRAAMLRLGLWREDYWDDWAFIVRLAYRYGFTFVPKPLACVRAHDQNLGKKIVANGFDNILNIYNQQVNIFSEALPATPRLMAYRARLDKQLSHMCMIAMVRALSRFDWSGAGANFRRARYLYPLAGVDPGFIILALGNAVKRYREGKRRRAARLNKSAISL